METSDKIRKVIQYAQLGKSLLIVNFYQKSGVHPAFIFETPNLFKPAETHDWYIQISDTSITLFDENHLIGAIIYRNPFQETYEVHGYTNEYALVLGEFIEMLYLIITQHIGESDANP